MPLTRRSLPLLAALLLLLVTAGSAGATVMSIDSSVQIWTVADSSSFDVEEAGALSPDGVYGYYSANGCPAHIAKVRMADLTRVADVATSSSAGDGECALSMAAAISPDGATGYFGSNGGSPKLLVVRLADMTITDRIPVLDGAVDRGGINKLILSADGTKAYTVMNNGYMLEVTLATGTVTNSLDLTTQLRSWLRVVRSPDGAFAYVSSFSGWDGAAHVVKVRLSDLSVVADLALDPGPVAPIAGMSTSTWTVSPDGAYLYYSVDEHSSWEGLTPTLAKVRTSDMTQVGTMAFPDADVQNTSAAISPDGATLYVGSQHGHVYKVDTATLTIAQDLDLNVAEHCGAVAIPDLTGCAARSALVSPDASFLYVTNWYNGLVKIRVAPDPAPAEDPPATIEIARVSQSGGRLTVRIRISDPGRVVLRASRIVKGEAIGACVVASDLSKAGTRTVSCLLNRKARSAVAAGKVRLRVAVTLRPAGGALVADTSTTTLARDRTAD